MNHILASISEHTKIRVTKDKQIISLDGLKEICFSDEFLNQQKVNYTGGIVFEQALRLPKISFICEIKKASPSKGVISEEFPYLEIAGEYESAGARAISCLTEPKWFLGSDQIFTDIRTHSSLPMLRKDFTVDAYQLYQARLLGANAVLLICALLDTRTIADYLEICDQLGLAALVEAHTEKEVKSALAAGARIVGVNNRNLDNFSVDFKTAISLRSQVPADVIFVAESGIDSPEHISELAKAGVDAVLIGEALMRAKNKSALLSELRGEK